MVVTPTSQRNFLAAITKNIVPALRDEGLLGEELATVDWDAWDAARTAETLTETQTEQAAAAARIFFASKRKLELMAWAWTSDVHLGPVNTTRDLLENPQLQARGYWQELDGIVRPGLSVRSSRFDLDLRAPAPKLGRASGADRALAHHSARRSKSAGRCAAPRRGVRRTQRLSTLAGWPLGRSPERRWPTTVRP